MKKQSFAPCSAGAALPGELPPQARSHFADYPFSGLQQGDIHVQCRRLSSDQDLASYRSLLYRMYIEDKRWEVTPRNAAGLRVEQGTAGVSPLPMLCDRFDAVAHVFGVFDETGVLCAGLRVVEPLEGRLELDVLHSMPQRFKASYLRRLELSRCVVAKGHDCRTQLVTLLRSVAQFLQGGQCDLLFAGVAEPEHAVVLRKLGFVSSDQAMFRPAFLGSPMARMLHLDCRVNGALDQLMSRVYDSDAA